MGAMPTTDLTTTAEIATNYRPPKRPRNNFEYRTNQLAMDLRHGRLRRQQREKKGR